MDEQREGDRPNAGQRVLEALLASLDGQVVLRTRVAGEDPVDVGRTAALETIEARCGDAGDALRH